MTRDEAKELIEQPRRKGRRARCRAKPDYVVAGAEAGSKLERRPHELGVAVGSTRKACAEILEESERVRKVTKGGFPVAGMGSRFLPATKASPKEMMPIVDKPLIQYAVEEAVAAGIRGHGVHHRPQQARRSRTTSTRPTRSRRSSQRARKTDLLALIQDIVPKSVNCIYIRQSEAARAWATRCCARRPRSTTRFSR